MKPLKLVISAFGPYADLQTVDFQELKDKNIFLITGPTGAGKTTIFDAISYALFGEASGSSRSKDSLRSDFAPQDTLTFVELDFELRDKVYKVKRIPQQERRKLKGEGMVLKNTEAELLLPDGEMITRVTAVDEKISEILGINKNQFRQIVMLPQGEFRKLLEAESKEREGIFRKIFGTEAFESVQRKLEEQRKSINNKIREKQTRRDTHAKNIEIGEDDALHRFIHAKDMNIAEITNRAKGLIEEDEEKSKAMLMRVKGIEEKEKKLQQRITEGEEINKKIKVKLELEQEYNDHVCKEEVYKEKQLQLDRGRKTLPIIELENTFNQRKSALDKKKQEHKKAIENMEKVKESLLLAIEKLKEEEAKEPERKKLFDSISTLKSRQNKVREYEEKKNSIEELRKDLRKKENAVQKLKGEMKEEKDKLLKINEEFKKAQRAEVDYEKRSKMKDKKDGILEEIRGLYKYTKRYVTKSSKYEEEKKGYEKLDNKFKNIKSNYENIEDNFRRGQAGLLAKDLKEGTSCPVCGSNHHPNPAKAVEGIPTEEALKEMKLKLDKTGEVRDSKYGEVAGLYGDIKNSKEELIERRDSLASVLGEEIKDLQIEYILSYLEEQGKRLSIESEKLEKELKDLEIIIKKKDKLEIDSQKCEETINKFSEDIEKLESAYTKEYGMVKGEEELLNSIEKEIPIEIRSFSKLVAKIEELEELLDKLERNHKKAQENHNKANVDYSSCDAEAKGHKKHVEEGQEELGGLRVQLEDRIKAAGFEDYQQYNALKMQEEEIKELEIDINQYHQMLKSLKDRLDKAVKDTEKLEKEDLEELAESLKQLKEKRELLEEEDKQIFSRINNNKKALKEIEAINEDIKKEEEVFGIVADLSKIANGDNEERVTFERYVLAAYFDEIIRASNTRLKKMAAGRYILRRKEDRSKGRRQEGLELEVFDHYTGKARHVKTLSGGESFKASLSLALGLADVVQSYAGGIKLDTMFVDEGFGTLDPESLDNAIQCLIDLQKDGRLVGIISHVPELKERIDVRLEITPAKEGSKVKFVI